MAKASAIGSQFVRKIALGFSILLCALALGADVTIPSTYDEESDTWIGDVTELTNAIKTAVANQKIILSKGVYDLSPLTNAPMYEANGSGYGAALIWANKKGVKFIGETGDPADVVIKATDSMYRLICLNSANSGLYNATVTGGNAAGDHINTYNFRCGGGVLLSGGNSIVSNCVFTGNKAGTNGGAVSGPNTLEGYVYDSVFYGNNDSTQYALAASKTRCYNCIFTNNQAVAEKSDGYTGSIAAGCRLYGCLFADNRAGLTGGVSGGIAVNCTFLRNKQDNINGNNWGHPGGGGAYGAVLSNCTFWGNSAYRLGGAIRGGSVVNCTVISNATRLASESYGGGIYSSYVENCNVSSNVSASGGGVSNCTVFDTDILYNTAKSGGGARASALTDCVIAHNVATDYGNGNYGGAGGGMRYGAATNCVFRDNSCSATWESSVLKGCEITDTSMHVGVIDSCVIHDVRNVAMARAVGNVAYPDGFVTSNGFMIGGCELMRNTLVTNCTWESIKGTYINSAMFEPNGAITARVENCSFIDNYTYLLARNYTNEARTISFVNSVFHSTRNGNRKDISRLSCQYMVLSNCVYGTTENNAIAEGYENSGCVILKDRAAYKFIAKGDHPYSLRRSSPLRGMGLVLDWMAEGVDYIGNPRLRDGKVDVGCYQCWLDPIGTVMSFR